MAGLYYGNWISQFAARAAGGGTQEEGPLLMPLNKDDWDVDGAGRNLYLTLGALVGRWGTLASDRTTLLPGRRGTGRLGAHTGGGRSLMMSSGIG